jgi:hypothetical protein
VTGRHSESGGTLVVQFTTSDSCKGARHFEKTQKATYRTYGSDEFALDPDGSTLSEEEMRDVFWSEGHLNKEDFAKYYHEELERIAAGTNSSRRNGSASFYRTSNRSSSILKSNMPS